MPKSIKDLEKPEYKGKIAVTDITSSSTAWLLIQGLISEYGEEDSKEILTDIYENAGDHLEESGSGSFGVESVLGSVVPKDGCVLLLSNGAYGERAAKMCSYYGISCIHVTQEYNQTPDVKEAEDLLNTHPEITHIMMIHSETTSGILNDVESIGELAKKYGKVFIVDAMSSFAGVEILVKGWHIDFLISSANKCIQGVPGFSFIIANKAILKECKGRARSLSLDLYDQWAGMEKDGKWRYTSPIHVVLAFEQAMKELEQEGGIQARHAQEMYTYIKERGYAIYPGKLTEIMKSYMEQA